MLPYVIIKRRCKLINEKNKLSVAEKFLYANVCFFEVQSFNFTQWSNLFCFCFNNKPI